MREATRASTRASDSAFARGKPSKVPPGRVIVAAFLLTVAAFVLSTVVATSQLRAVSEQSKAIATNAMPGVIALTTLRERLDELVSSLNSAVDSAGTPGVAFDATVAEIEAQSAAYEARALPPERRDPWQRAKALTMATVTEARRVRDDLAAGRVAEARITLDDEVRPGAAGAHKALWELVERNAVDGEQLAHRIGLVRRSATLLLFFLDAACVGVALTLTVAALGAVARHTTLLEHRSEELEIFSARVAHDLLGPLTPVTLLLQRLRRESAPDDARGPMIDRSARALGRVTSLVDDLLDFARSGGRVAGFGRASALAVATATLEEASALAESNAIELRIDPHAEDVTLACPPGVLTSLVSNLVHNAIKYLGSARERRVVVRASRRGDRARVEVEDTGPGLPPGAENDVFEPYVRVDRSGQPGLGLGLATVKRLAEGYGGSVGVRSGPGGCTFWFELPAVMDR
jgi:signal transduction histidine kinase